MSEVWRGWDDAGKLLDLLINPFKYAVEWAAPVGGAVFLASLLGLSIALYTWWHTKDALPAGLVAAITGAFIAFIPEVSLAGFLLLAFGGAALAYRLLKTVMGP